MMVLIGWVITFAQAYYVFGIMFGVGMLISGAGIKIAIEMLLAWPLHLVLLYYHSSYDWFDTMDERIDYIREERHVHRVLRDIERRHKNRS